MKIFKRNQLLILVMALMLVTAGYLNFSSKSNNKQDVVESSIALANSEESTQIGDAKLVNTDIAEPIATESPSIEERIEPKLVSNTEDKDYYYENSRLDRDKMYSQMLESYQKMYEGAGNSTEQKSMAAKEIAKINTTKNAIMICENLIKNKGIHDIVIFVNDDQISVVVNEKQLNTEQLAQIQNIISREMNASIENIHISCK